jgi:hypothetical protein
MYARILLVFLQKQASVYAKLVQQGCEEGLFHTDTPLETVEFIIISVQFLLDQQFYKWSDETILRRIKVFPSLIEKLLDAPAGSFSFYQYLQESKRNPNDKYRSKESKSCRSLWIPCQ